jgi:hypothetical protein
MGFWAENYRGFPKPELKQLLAGRKSTFGLPHRQAAARHSVPTSAGHAPGQYAVRE